MANKVLVISGISAVLFIGYLIYNSVTEPVFRQSDTSIDIADDPAQKTLKDVTLAPMQLGSSRFFFDVKASYTLKGMLVSKRRYSRGFMSRLSPYDYAIIWGKTIDMLPHLRFTQTYRYCLYNYKLSTPVDPKYVQSHMSNNHMIPSTQNIRKALKYAKKGDLVEIEGYLVYVTATSKNKGTSNWNSSLIREDDGNGACEVIYITKLRIKDKIYE